MSTIHEFFKSEDIQAAYKTGERMTRLSAEQLVEVSGIRGAAPSSSPLKILDTGCGNGILSEVLRHEMAESQSENLQVTGIDSSEAMVKAANERIKVKGWKNDSASVADMQSMHGLEKASFDYIVSNLSINFPPNANATIKEHFRVLESGGTLTFTTWSKVGWIGVAGEAFKRVEGAPAMLSEETMFNKIQSGNPWNTASFQREKLSEHGFVDIEITERPIVPGFNSKEFALLFGGPMVKGILGGVWSKEDIDKYADRLAPALVEMFAEKGIETPEFEMAVLVTKVRKP